MVLKSPYDTHSALCSCSLLSLRPRNSKEARLFLEVDLAPLGQGAEVGLAHAKRGGEVVVAEVLLELLVVDASRG